MPGTVENPLIVPRVRVCVNSASTECVNSASTSVLINTFTFSEWKAMRVHAIAVLVAAVMLSAIVAGVGRGPNNPAPAFPRGLPTRGPGQGGSPNERHRKGGNGDGFGDNRTCERRGRSGEYPRRWRRSDEGR